MTIIHQSEIIPKENNKNSLKIWKFARFALSLRYKERIIDWTVEENECNNS